MAPFFLDLSQSEKLSEMKPPLLFFLLSCWSLAAGIHTILNAPLEMISPHFPYLPILACLELTASSGIMS